MNGGSRDEADGENMSNDHDVIVIGSGQAGVPLATRLAGAGRQVMLVERAALGGTCVNYGCTPTKTLIASARAAHVARNAARLGVFAGPVVVDMPAVIARKDAIVKEWREGVGRRLAGAGPALNLHCGHARFAAPREIEVNGERHRADVIIINTGARPAAPQITGLGDVPWLDSQRALDLEEVPEHLVILGGGYIGCELGQMFRRFGARVTVIERGPHLLGREDPEVSDALLGVFEAEGIAVEPNATVEEVSSHAQGIAVRLGDGRKITGSHLLVATGRRPNTDELGCQEGGIDLDSRGFIVVDEGFQTSAEQVFAVGDVAGSPQFTHTAWDEHRHLFDRLMGRPWRRRSARTVPSVVFTDPQVAVVGLREHEAAAQGVEHEVARMPFGHVARAMEIDETAGLLKVLIDPQTEQVLGASLVGAEAGELLHVFVALMEAKAPARAIVDAEFVHPTLAEGLQSLLMSLGRFEPK
jgi:pyruvate/2-oxoglutarate dehydrogenase complex dihydrolipoamide dehydrogenase (E3) component